MKAYFEVTVRERNSEEKCISYNEGYIRIEDGKMEGYLTYDFINGYHDDNVLEINFFEYNSNIEYIITIPVDSFQIPGIYIAKIEEKTFQFDFFTKIKDVQKQKDIDKEIERIKAKHSIL